MSNSYHTPVLLQEVIHYLDIGSGGVVLDGTIGGGGYATYILDNYPNIKKYIGIDQDLDAITFVQNNIRDKRLWLVNDNFSNVNQIVAESGVKFVNKIILDLGVSSFQLDNAQRGFSYMHDGPLDMRMNKNNKLTAEIIVNKYLEKEISDILFQLGEEPANRMIAKVIVNSRRRQPIRTTFQLVEIVKQCVKGSYVRKLTGIKRVFQALRIEVNGELSVLKNTIESMVKLLPSKGRLVIISFHSLEDRVVKQTLAQFISSENEVRVIKLSKKPVIACAEELKINTRAQSAKLRAIEKV